MKSNTIEKDLEKIKNLMEGTHLNQEQVIVSDAIDQIREIKTELSEMKTQYQDGMKAIREGCDESDEILCPVCRESLACNDDDEEFRPKHCPECGTKILY